MTHLQRWDIVFLKADENDTTGHPAVVLSPPDILEDPRQLRFNVLVGTKKPPAARAKSSEVQLDAADGLDFNTLINATLVYQARKSSVIRPAGRVAYARRSQIATKLRAALGLG
jgi:mRNA-degrading endonuclease toxin of MazEF toxin-antitoxin module